VGTLLSPAFATAVLHVTRHSLWVPLLGVPFERAVAFHRMASSLALILMFTHVVMMVNERGVPILASRSPNAAGAGAAFGTASATVFAVMGTLALWPVRRRAWKVFKASHLILFPTGLVLAMMHAETMVGYLMPPLILYALDVLLRVQRSSRVFSVRCIRPLPGGVVRIDVATQGRLRVAPGQYVHMQLPSLSPVEWHPLSCVCDPGRPDVLSFLVSGGSTPSTFGGRVAALAAEAPHTRALWTRLDGVYGGPGLQLRYYTSVLLIAGGVGIAPFYSIARYFLTAHAERLARSDAEAHEHHHHHHARRRRFGAVAPPLCSAAALVWSVRTERAAEKYMPGFLEELRNSGLFFNVRVCVTGEGATAADLHVGAAVDGGAGGGAGGEGEPGSMISYGRPDLHAAVRASLEAATAAGQPACRVAVLACGPQGLVDAAQIAAAALGCHFHAERFVA
jgi:hypothetical protein